MKEKLSFVQFIHPGGEHSPDHGNKISWNRNSHKRKFVKNTGVYCDGKDLFSKDLMFWCEWEPESRIVQEIIGPLDYGPTFIYEPYYNKPTSYFGLQGTDPFVFGDNFYYTGCQQHLAGAPNQLRYLQVGSVILFGSCLSLKHFALDTVFVVEKWIDHNKYNFNQVLRNLISDTYFDVGIAPWYPEYTSSPNNTSTCEQLSNIVSYRLYYGASFNSKMNEMYSFFPCLPYKENTHGFVRPIIKIPGIITNNLQQGKKLNPQWTIQIVKELWDVVVLQVLDQGLNLGVYSDLPRIEQ